MDDDENEELLRFWTETGYEWSRSAGRNVMDPEACHRGALLFAMGVLTMEALMTETLG